MSEMGDENSTTDAERRVEELLRINGELAAEIHTMRRGGANPPRTAAMPAARRVGRLAEERDALVAERDSLAAELDLSRVEHDALRRHADVLEDKVRDQAHSVEELSREVTRLRGGAAGLLRRVRARLARRG